MDLNSWERNARRKGEEIGKVVGAILAYERMLQRPQTPEEQLLALPLEDLKRLAEDLEKQALARR